MATVFTRIIDGELPGQFVWRDELAVAFLSINPVRTGHTLVVPRAEVDHWIDLDAPTVAHLAEVARVVGRALARAYRPTRVGLLVAGFEVPHTHLHVIPVGGMDDLDLANAARSVDPGELAAAAATIRDALRELGAGGVSD